jgi:hypothetical protein
LKKLSLPLNQELQEEAAISVTNEALRSLKERLLTRAEIIQRRLEAERTRLENAHVSFTVRRYFRAIKRSKSKFEFL